MNKIFRVNYYSGKTEMIEGNNMTKALFNAGLSHCASVIDFCEEVLELPYEEKRFYIDDNDGTEPDKVQNGTFLEAFKEKELFVGDIVEFDYHHHYKMKVKEVAGTYVVFELILENESAEEKLEKSDN